MHGIKKAPRLKEKKGNKHLGFHKADFNILKDYLETNT